MQAAGSLWLGVLLSELNIVGPTAFCALVYTALFALPATYIRCRWDQAACASQPLLPFGSKLV